jgi:hypothetical protein
MLILSPISYPLAWLLDRFFGSHNPRKRYNRAELSALIEIHQVRHPALPPLPPFLPRRVLTPLHAIDPSSPSLFPPSLLPQEVKRRNISIVPSGGTHQGNGNGGSSSSNSNQAPHHAYMSASSATSARAGLLSVSNPGVGRGGGAGGGKREKGRLISNSFSYSRKLG